MLPTRKGRELQERTHTRRHAQRHLVPVLHTTRGWWVGENVPDVRSLRGHSLSWLSQKAEDPDTTCQPQDPDSVRPHCCLIVRQRYTFVNGYYIRRKVCHPRKKEESVLPRTKPGKIVVNSHLDGNKQH